MIECDWKQKGGKLWKNKPKSLSPEDLDASMTNVQAEEHAFTKSVLCIIPQQFLLWDLKDRGEAFTSVHERLLSVVVHSRSEVTLQKSFRMIRNKKLIVTPIEIWGDRWDESVGPPCSTCSCGPRLDWQFLASTFGSSIPPQKRVL